MSGAEGGVSKNRSSDLRRVLIITLGVILAKIVTLQPTGLGPWQYAGHALVSGLGAVAALYYVVLPPLHEAQATRVMDWRQLLRVSAGAGLLLFCVVRG